jgi:hypothetical protein
MFDQLPLHDSTLFFVHLDWTKGDLTLQLETTEMQRGRLIFSEIDELFIPRGLPWGPSASINRLRITDTGAFEVEMQSGDVLIVRAKSWTFVDGGGS